MTEKLAFSDLDERLSQYREGVKDKGFDTRWLRGDDKLAVDTMEREREGNLEYLLRVVYSRSDRFSRKLKIEGAAGIRYTGDEFTDFQILTSAPLMGFGDRGSVVREVKLIVPGQKHKYGIEHVDSDSGKASGKYTWGSSGVVKQIWLNGNPLV